MVNSQTLYLKEHFSFHSSALSTLYLLLIKDRALVRFSADSWPTLGRLLASVGAERLNQFAIIKHVPLFNLNYFSNGALRAVLISAIPLACDSNGIPAARSMLGNALTTPSHRVAVHRVRTRQSPEFTVLYR